MEPVSPIAADYISSNSELPGDTTEESKDQNRRWTQMDGDFEAAGTLVGEPDLLPCDQICLRADLLLPLFVIFVIFVAKSAIAGLPCSEVRQTQRPKCRGLEARMELTTKITKITKT
jgi:hypothetical protein